MWLGWFNMNVFNFSSDLILVFLLIVHEVVFRYVEHKRDDQITRKWVNEGYPCLAPQNFNKDFFGDVRYYVLLLLLFLCSCLLYNDLLMLLIINVYLSVNTISHLTSRFFKTIRYISLMRINGRGADIENCGNVAKNWNEAQLFGVRKWINEKFDLLNMQLFTGIQICKKNKSEGLVHLNRIDVKFLRKEFIISPLQAIYSNCIFLGHVLAVVVINAMLLYRMSCSGLMETDSIKYGFDAFYLILQMISTVGFGDITNSPYQTLGSFHMQCFFIVMFIQVILTVILGIAYKNSTLMQASEIFDNLSQLFNEKIEYHKNLCIEAILTGHPSDYLMEDVEKGYSDLGKPAYTMLVHELTDYIKTLKSNADDGCV